MARQHDRRGLAVTATSREAALHFDAAVDAFLGHRADCAARLADALGADPGFLMAHCLKGFACKLLARQEFDTAAGEALLAARASSRSRGATARENAYIAALHAWCDGEMSRAGDVLTGLTVQEPLDLLALKLHHALHFMLGDRRAMLGTLRRAIGAWNEGVVGFGYALGCLAFALEETGAYSEAESTGRRALTLIPSDIWAAHAVAHVFEMRGEPETGLRWLARCEPAFADCNNLTFHLAWHRALFHLELDQPDRALELYDTAVRPNETEDYRDISNAASLLWRLENGGIDVGARWRELADKAERRLGDPSLVFASIHHIVSLTGDRRFSLAETMLRSLRLQAKRQSGTQAAVLAEIGIVVAEAFVSARQRRHARVVDLLFPLRHRIALIGGSNTQQDLIVQLLIDAAIRAGRQSEALILLEERSRARQRVQRAVAWSKRIAAPDSELIGRGIRAAQAGSNHHAL